MNYSPKVVANRLFGGKGRVAPRTLQKLNLFAAAVLVFQSAALLIFGVVHTVPVYISHVTGDALQTKLHGAEATSPALHELWRLNVAYVAIAALLVTAVVYALLATVWRAKYEAWLKKEMQPLRWVIVAISGGLMLVTLGLVAGVGTLADLKSILVFTILAGLVAAWLELHPVRRGKLDAATWLGVVIGLVSALMPLLMIFDTILATNIFGSIGVPGHVWLLSVVLTVSWLLFIGSMHLTNLKQGRWGNYLVAEAWYTGLILAVETVFVWVLFAAVLHP